MHKYTILFIVLCAIVVASAEPGKRKSVARKSAKIVRPSAIKAIKSAKMQKSRRSGKITAHAHGSAKINFDHEHVPQFHHVEAPFHDEVHHVPHHEHEVVHHVPHHGHEVVHHEVFDDFNDQAMDDEVMPEIIIADEEFEQDFPELHHATPVDDDVQFNEVEEPVFIEEEIVIAKEAPRAVGSGARYFNTNFGATKDGSIALANSYSTGQKGSAHSTATSHGKKGN